MLLSKLIKNTSNIFEEYNNIYLRTANFLKKLIFYVPRMNKI